MFGFSSQPVYIRFFTRDDSCSVFAPMFFQTEKYVLSFLPDIDILRTRDCLHIIYQQFFLRANIKTAFFALRRLRTYCARKKSLKWRPKIGFFLGEIYSRPLEKEKLMRLCTGLLNWSQNSLLDVTHSRLFFVCIIGNLPIIPYYTKCKFEYFY